MFCTSGAEEEATNRRRSRVVKAVEEGSSLWNKGGDVRRESERDDSGWGVLMRAIGDHGDKRSGHASCPASELLDSLLPLQGLFALLGFEVSYREISSLKSQEFSDFLFVQ